MALIVKMKFVNSMACAFFVLSALAGMASISASDLKQRIKISAPTVYLSDIFTDISYDKDKILFEAPLPGQNMQISTSQLWQIAQSNGVAWEKPVINKRIRIQREGRPVNMAVLRVLLEEEILARGFEGNIQVNIYGIIKNLYLPIDSDELDIEIDTLNINPNSNRYSANLLWPTGEGAFVDINLNGLIEQVHLLPVLARMMIPGDIITMDDIDWIKVPVKKITSNSIKSTDDFIGFTPRRALAANKMLRTSDVEALRVIKKGHQVVVSYISGALVLTTAGKALEHGAVGDTIRIMNLRSHKTIYAQVTGEGHVKIYLVKPNQQLASR